MTTLTLEWRQAVRALDRMRGTTALSIATLALGIAAAATTFSAAYAALIRPVPFVDPSRLLIVQVTRQTAREGTVRLRWSFDAAQAVRRDARSFASIGTFSRASVGIGPSTALSAGPATGLTTDGSDEAEQVEGEIVTAGYFDALRMPPAIGRGMTAADDAPGHAIVLIGDGLWRRRFGGDPAVLGRAVNVNGVPLSIVGVMPAGFDGVSGRAVVWIPAGMAPQLTYREYLTSPQHFINLVARLRTGVSLAQANAELDALGPRLPNEIAPDAPPARWSAAAQTLGDARIDAPQRRSLLLIAAGGGCVLLVTCVNVAALLLTRARSRRGEMAIRLALGATRWRLTRQLLAESFMIAAAGGALGLIVASWGVAWLARTAPDVIASPQNDYGQIAAFATPSIDAVVLGFVALLALGTTIVAGAAPALVGASADPADALALSARSVAGRGGAAGLAGLVLCQIAVAVLLLSGALLLVKTLSHLEAPRAAFDGAALTFWIEPPASRYRDADGPAIVRRVLERITTVPGVTAAAVNRCTPYGARCARTLIFFPEHPTRPSDAPVVGRHYVSPAYFRALGIPLRRGRALQDDDRMGRPPVAVVNETAARRFWPGDDPIGKKAWFSSAFTSPDAPVEIVGVVADVKYWPLNEPVGPDVYTSYLQYAYPSSMYLVKASGAAAVVPAIRRAIAEVDPTLALSDVRLLDDRVAAAVARPRFTAAATAIFAIAAALLAATGVFGVMAYSVSLRREELALRLALGATPRGLRVHVLGRAARLAAGGTAAGVLAAIGLLRSLGSALYGVSASDPLVLTLSAVSMGLAALAAAAAPAWRAGRTDPLVALRRS